MTLFVLCTNLMILPAPCAGEMLAVSPNERALKRLRRRVDAACSRPTRTRTTFAERKALRIAARRVSRSAKRLRASRSR